MRKLSAGLLQHLNKLMKKAKNYLTGLCTDALNGPILSLLLLQLVNFLCIKRRKTGRAGGTWQDCIGCVLGRVLPRQSGRARLLLLSLPFSS